MRGHLKPKMLGTVPKAFSQEEPCKGIFPSCNFQNVHSQITTSQVATSHEGKAFYGFEWPLILNTNLY